MDHNFQTVISQMSTNELIDLYNKITNEQTRRLQFNNADNKSDDEMISGINERIKNLSLTI